MAGPCRFTARSRSLRVRPPRRSGRRLERRGRRMAEAPALPTRLPARRPEEARGRRAAAQAGGSPPVAAEREAARQDEARQEAEAADRRAEEARRQAEEAERAQVARRPRPSAEPSRAPPAAGRGQAHRPRRDGGRPQPEPRPRRRRPSGPRRSGSRRSCRRPGRAGEAEALRAAADLRHEQARAERRAEEERRAEASGHARSERGASAGAERSAGAGREGAPSRASRPRRSRPRPPGPRRSRREGGEGEGGPSEGRGEAQAEAEDRPQRAEAEAGGGRRASRGGARMEAEAERASAWPAAEHERRAGEAERARAASRRSTSRARGRAARAGAAEPEPEREAGGPAPAPAAMPEGTAAGAPSARSAAAAAEARELCRRGSSPGRGGGPRLRRRSRVRSALLGSASASAWAWPRRASRSRSSRSRCYLSPPPSRARASTATSCARACSTSPCPFGLLAGLVVGVVVGVWYARGGRLPEDRPRSTAASSGLADPSVSCPGWRRPLCLLTVHAHPDDESSKGAGTVARYHAEGVRTVLVCCTGGEAGDILNPAMDQPTRCKADIAAVRRAELDRAAAIIGYDEVVMLGYRDSGMPDSEANANPRRFANAAARRGRRPAGRDHPPRRGRRSSSPTATTRSGYPHPDHLRVHDITQPAVDRAADPDWYPEAGRAVAGVEALLLGLVASKRIEPMHEKFLELGLESPFSDEWFERPWQDDRITTSIDIDGLRRRAPRRAARPRHPDRPRRRRSGSACPREVAGGDPPVRRLHPGPIARRRADARGRPVRRPRVPRSARSLVPTWPYLSQEWLDLPAGAGASAARSGRAPAPGCSTSSPARPTARSRYSLGDRATAGSPTTPLGATTPQADVHVLTQPTTTRCAIAQGRARPANAAFMQGRVKVSRRHGQAAARVLPLHRRAPSTSAIAGRAWPAADRVLSRQRLSRRPLELAEGPVADAGATPARSSIAPERRRRR